MNKRARAAAESARRADLDVALDGEIEAAVGPLCVGAGDLVQFDTQVSEPVSALSAAQARRLRSLVGAAHTRPGTLRSPAPLATSALDEAGDATFGALVQSGRKAAGLSVPNLARRIHVHRDYLTGLEAGTRSPLALGAEGARRLVGMLGLPPHAASLALETSMHAALVPVASFAARMKRGVPRKERLRLLASAVPDGPTAEEIRAWRAVIDAVESLDPQASGNDGNERR
jgi:hypothetical protein